MAMANSTAIMPVNAAAGVVLYVLAQLFTHQPQAVAVGYTALALAEVAPYYVCNYSTAVEKTKHFVANAWGTAGDSAVLVELINETINGIIEETSSVSENPSSLSDEVWNTATFDERTLPNETVLDVTSETITTTDSPSTQGRWRFLNAITGKFVPIHISRSSSSDTSNAPPTTDAETSTSAQTATTDRGFFDAITSQFARVETVTASSSDYAEPAASDTAIDEGTEDVGFGGDENVNPASESSSPTEVRGYLDALKSKLAHKAKIADSTDENVAASTSAVIETTWTSVHLTLSATETPEAEESDIYIGKDEEVVATSETLPLTKSRGYFNAMKSKFAPAQKTTGETQTPTETLNETESAALTETKTPIYHRVFDLFSFQYFSTAEVKSTTSSSIPPVKEAESTLEAVSSITRQGYFDRITHKFARSSTTSESSSNTVIPATDTPQEVTSFSTQHNYLRSLTNKFKPTGTSSVPSVLPSVVVEPDITKVVFEPSNEKLSIEGLTETLKSWADYMFRDFCPL